MALVYRHRRLDDNSIFYIGIGKYIKRAYDKRNRNKYWNNIVSSFGYKIEILKDDLSWEDACELEILLICEYGRKDLGIGRLVNMTDGGDGNNNIIYTDERRNRLSINNSGINNPMYGRQSSMYGKKHSDESKLKISKAKSGINHHLYNKKHSDESKLKISNTVISKEIRCKKIINIETGEIYKSITYLAKLLGIPRTTLNSILVGHVLTNKTPYRYYKKEE